MKYDVFISYSRKDTAIADQICAAFDKAGISYFIDRQGIGGGVEFPKVLAPAIKESEIFLLLASKNAYDSPFTDREITFAFNKKRGEKMLPYIIDDSPFPEHLELIFSSNNWRMLQIHPIETILIDDILNLLGQPTQNNTITIDDNDTILIDEMELEPDGDGDFLNMRWGFINKQGDIVIPYKFDRVKKFSDGLACVEKNHKWGFIDKKGNIIIPLVYESVAGIKDKYSGFHEGLAGVEKNGKYGFIDKKGNTVIPFEYDLVYSFSEGLASVVKNGKSGSIDKQGNIVIPFLEYEFVSSFSEGIAYVIKNGKYGFINRQGRIIIPIVFEDVVCDHYDVDRGCFQEGLAGVKKNGKWGFIDKQGDVVIPFEYDSVWGFYQGQAQVEKSLFGIIPRTYHIDKQGNRID